MRGDAAVAVMSAEERNEQQGLAAIPARLQRRELGEAIISYAVSKVLLEGLLS